MSHFTEHTKKKLTISTKPIPTGIKGWVIADKNFFLYSFWHARETSPQEISYILRPLGRNKIIAVILALLNTFSQGCSGTYSVILDNLFTSTKLLAYFYN